MQPEWDKFTPNFPIQYENNNYTTYDAMLAKRTDTGESFILIGIEGFDFEEGYDMCSKSRRKLNLSFTTSCIN